MGTFCVNGTFCGSSRPAEPAPLNGSGPTSSYWTHRSRPAALAAPAAPAAALESERNFSVFLPVEISISFITVVHHFITAGHTGSSLPQEEAQERSGKAEPNKHQMEKKPPISD